MMRANSSYPAEIRDLWDLWRSHGEVCPLHNADDGYFLTRRSRELLNALTDRLEGMSAALGERGSEQDPGGAG